MNRFLAILFSFFIAACGQPALFSFASFPFALFCYALFWRAMLSFPGKKKRFFLAFCWFAAVQLVQLSWFISHPYAYIYGVWLFFSLAAGLQFALLSLLVNERLAAQSWRPFVIAACWTLMEWSRLFFLSGYVWNPVGLAPASNPYFLQLASLAGVYGLSFLTILVNALVLRAWMTRWAIAPAITMLLAGFLPFIYGAAHYYTHQKQISRLEKNPASFFSALLVQTAFPLEELKPGRSIKELLNDTKSSWNKILAITKKHAGKSIDLIALPELAVPFGTYTFVYPYEEVKRIFINHFGEAVISKLPSPEYPLALFHENEWKVSNAYWTQAVANIFDAGVVIGLEDAEDLNGIREYYTAAIYILPDSTRKEGIFDAKRYAKRVLVPMGEYIPFDYCRKLAAQYGVFGSFTQGKGAEVWQAGRAAFGPSICYEEMFSNLMRQNRSLGADFLLNMTNDGWFPKSKLIRQHFEHSRLRSVENGFPLLRACNTGITCVIDSIGREVSVLGDSDASREELSDSLYASFPLYNYQTIYTRYGDGLIIGISWVIMVLFFLRESILLVYHRWF